MPRKTRGLNSKSDDNSDSTSSSEEGESSDSMGSKKSNQRKSRKDYMSRSSPQRDIKHGRDYRQHKESNSGQRWASSNKHYSDTSRMYSPARDMRRGEDRSYMRRREEEKDRQYQNNDIRRKRDTDQRKAGDNKDRVERRQRSHDCEQEKNKRGKDSRSSSYSRDRNSRNQDIKDDDNCMRQQKDVRKDKNSDTNTRRVRNDEKDDKTSGTHKSASKDLLKEKEDPKSGVYPDISKTGDRFRRDDNRSSPERKKLRTNKKEKEKKRKVSSSTSSSSSSDLNSSDSDSDVERTDGRRLVSKKVESNKESTISHQKKPEVDKHFDNTRKSEEVKAAGIESKKSDINQKDTFGIKLDQNGSEHDSDSSEHEKERNISKQKRGHSETEDNTEVEVYKDLQMDLNKVVTPEKQSSLSQEINIVNEARDGVSDDEKEEGELSEDNEDKISDKPLKAISDYVSDISSDDEQPDIAEPRGTQQQHTQHPQTTSASHVATEIAKESERNVEQLTKTSKEEKSDNKIFAKNKDGAELKNNSSENRKNDSFSDHEFVEGEDNSKRQRPVLESESEDDDDYDRKKGKGTLRGNPQTKQKIGSSVLIVRQEPSRRDRDRSVDRDGSRGRGWEDRQRRDKRERETRSRQDADKKKDGNGEAKRVPDKSEPKDTHVTKTGKPDNIAATKGTEEPGKKPVTAFDITSKTGGAYIPPAKLRMMQEQIKDKTSVAYQRMSWEALKKSINGLVNKVNVSNVISIVKELFQENIVRGRGLLARSVIQAQAASPTFTRVFAALVAIINTKFPQNGMLILRRLILMFRRGFKRNDKALCISTTMFIAHLVNQQVAHEILALEILTLLLENPTDDSVEVAISFLKECGLKLSEVSPRGINSIFERLRNVLHEGLLDVRVQYMVEVMFAIRKDGFKDHPSVVKDLDLVEETDQFTHLLQLEDAVTGDELLNVFKEDPAFIENEEKYKTLKKEILGEGSSDEETGDSDSSGSDSDDDDDDDDENEAEKQVIIDKTETNLVALRRNIYLTIQSSLDHNECAHKMLKMELKPGQEVELCNMILDCCAQLRTYEKFYGLLAQRFCQIDKKYIEPFQQIFVEQYETIHRLDTNKVRNVAKFFAHMLHTDAISWGVLSVIKLTEEETTSASRIFLKILFQELSEYMGLPKLNERLKDPTLSPYFSGIMARDNPKNTRFCINFFTTIGLGGLTDDLREHLKTTTKQIAQQKEKEDQAEQEGSSSSSEFSSDSSESDSSSNSESDDLSKRKHKLPASKTNKKSLTDNPQSKKKTTDKENKRTSRHARKSSDRDSEYESRSKSSGRGRAPNVNEKNMSLDKNQRTIADRLLDMAQYGNIRNGDERSRERSDRFDREKETRPQLNRRDGRESRNEWEGREFDKNRENEERWGQSNRRWSNFDGNQGRRRDDMGYRNRGEEDERRKGGRQYEGNNFRRRENNFYQSNDASWDLRSDNVRSWKNEYAREDMRQNVDGERGNGVGRGEKRKERRHDSSSDDSESSPEQVRHSRRRSLSETSEKQNRRQSLDIDMVQKQGNQKRLHKKSTSNVDSVSGSSDDDHSKSSKSKRENRETQSLKVRSGASQKLKRKKSLSSSASLASSTSSDDDETMQERRIITKKPRLTGDKDLKRQEAVDKRISENNRAKKRR